jgi:ferredoxin
MDVHLSMLRGWLLACGPALLLGLAILALLIRRAQLRDDARSHKELVRARERGSHSARLQHPEIDLSQCIGCGACARACPEEGAPVIPTMMPAAYPTF